MKQDQWVQYLMTGWGQNLSGSALSVAATVLPIVSAGTPLPTPKLFTSPALPQRSTAPVPVIIEPTREEEVRQKMAAALRSVVQPGGTAHSFFSRSPVAGAVGGKTGTIQIESVQPSYAYAKDPAAFRRILHHSCGVFESHASQKDWETIPAEYLRVMETTNRWPKNLPPEGFAESDPRCHELFNPGLPRARASSALAPPAGEWADFLDREMKEGGREKMVSSAFVAVALDPLVQVTAPPQAPGGAPQQIFGDAVGQNWILAVIVDDLRPSPDDPVTAKRLAVSILEALQRHLEVRHGIRPR